MSDLVSPTALSEVQLRFLCHDDIENVKLLCGDWFPIEYPDSWYQDITSNKKFFSLAATFRGGIVGMIVAEIKGRTKVHKEDGDILASSFPVDTQVGRKRKHSLSETAKEDRHCHPPLTLLPLRVRIPPPPQSPHPGPRLPLSPSLQ
uniref:N-alpha-acetyltransferase 60-like n=1 Tax=Gasterosteus aculeatus aculeatus TaxID=481459 RepID=UPI001A97EC44|nr:N-alpha-acetyltransferase 60-like [Gasterosteus aculeatus aculeatus]XP_040046245.1 N-alpha-acetyltransferase 60-like [Gasterosteus aculeatus aculeatus]